MTPEERQAEIKKRIDAISVHAQALYDAMVPGMTVEVNISGSPIVMPGQPRKMHRLYIHRPVVYFNLKLE